MFASIWQRIKALLASEPAMLAALGQAAVAAIALLGFHLTAGQTGALSAAAAAVAAAITGLRARPVKPALLTGALTALGAVMIAFGVPHVTSGLVATASTFLAAIMSTVLRSHVTPIPLKPAPLTASSPLRAGTPGYRRC